VLSHRADQLLKQTKHQHVAVHIGVNVVVRGVLTAIKEVERIEALR
jgi:hypothetical protein